MNSLSPVKKHAFDFSTEPHDTQVGAVTRVKVYKPGGAMS